MFVSPSLLVPIFWSYGQQRTQSSIHYSREAGLAEGKFRLKGTPRVFPCSILYLHTVSASASIALSIFMCEEETLSGRHYN